MNEKVKTCKLHGDLIASEVYMYKYTKHCKKCLKDYNSKNKEKFNDLQKLQTSQLSQRLDGIKFTSDDYFKMLAAQNNVCAICKREQKQKRKDGKPIRLAIDHCRKTKKVRGLLCTSCNQGIGKFQDSIEYLEGAIKYLSNSN